MEAPRPLTETETRIVRIFKQAAENHAAIKGVKTQWSIYHLSREAGLDLSSYPKEGLVIQAIWIAFLSVMKSYSHDCELKYPSLADFQHAYSGEFTSCNSYELNNLWQIANWMSILFSFIPAKKNKGFALTVVCKLVEGWYIKYVTGSGQTKATRDRVKIFEVEGNIKPAPRCSKLHKERLLAASTTTVGRTDDDDAVSVTSSLTSAESISMSMHSSSSPAATPTMSSLVISVEGVQSNINTSMASDGASVLPLPAPYSSPRSGDQGIGHTAKRSRKSSITSNCLSKFHTFGPEFDLFTVTVPNSNLSSNTPPLSADDATTTTASVASTVATTAFDASANVPEFMISSSTSMMIPSFVSVPEDLSLLPVCSFPLSTSTSSSSISSFQQKHHSKLHAPAKRGRPSKKASHQTPLVTSNLNVVTDMLGSPLAAVATSASDGVIVPCCFMPPMRSISFVGYEGSNDDDDINDNIIFSDFICMDEEMNRDEEMITDDEESVGLQSLQSLDFVDKNGHYKDEDNDNDTDTVDTNIYVSKRIYSREHSRSGTGSSSTTGICVQDDDNEFQSLLGLMRERSGMTWRQSSLTLESISSCCSVGYSTTINAFASTATASTAAKIMFSVVPMDEDMMQIDSDVLAGLPLTINDHCPITSTDYFDYRLCQ